VATHQTRHAEETKRQHKKQPKESTTTGKLKREKNKETLEIHNPGWLVSRISHCNPTEGSILRIHFCDLPDLPWTLQPSMTFSQRWIVLRVIEVHRRSCGVQGCFNMLEVDGNI